MPRETTTVEIGGHKFEIKTYATAREANAIQQGYFKGTKMELVGDQPKLTEFNPGIQFEVQQELIRQLVVKMDGTDDGIVERCLELRSDIFDEIVAHLDALVSKKKN